LSISPTEIPHRITDKKFDIAPEVGWIPDRNGTWNKFTIALKINQHITLKKIDLIKILLEVIAPSK
jgi:hypothetical protein